MICTLATRHDQLRKETAARDCNLSNLARELLRRRINVAIFQDE
jgi:hypothetical protein